MDTDCYASTIRKPAPGRIPTTQTSLVRAAQASATPAQTHAALCELCVLYSRPIHVFIRCWLSRHGRNPQEAADLAQAFMADLLGRGVATYRAVHEGRPIRFRTWLLRAVQYFVIKTIRGLQCQKKDERLTQSWEALSPMQRLTYEPIVDMSAERMFTITFASALNDHAWHSTRDWYAARGRVREFDLLERYIPGDEIADFEYEAVAAELGRTRLWVRSAVSDLRTRYQTSLRVQIRKVVPREREIDQEFSILFGERADAADGDDGV